MKSLKKSLSLLLALVMAVSVMSVGAFAWGSDYESQNDFTISSLDELKAFRDMVNSGKTFEDKTVTLAVDINLGGEAWEPIGNGGRNGSTIEGKKFSGTFDGGNHTISGLLVGVSTVDVDENGEYSDGERDMASAGLFGATEDATIKNLTIRYPVISSTGNNSGALIGLMKGGSVSNVVVYGNAVSSYEGAGGIVGRVIIGGTIDSCVNNGTKVSATARCAGGIVGTIYRENAVNPDGDAPAFAITNCSNSGSVQGTECVGGIVGFSWATVKGNTNLGNVTIVSGGTSKYAGGIVGEQRHGGLISGNTNNGAVTGGNTMGAIVGCADYLDAPSTTYTVTIKDNANYYTGLTKELGGKGENGTVTETMVAAIGNNQYTSLQSAVTAAAEGATIELLTNVALSREVFVSTKGETINHYLRGSDGNASFQTVNVKRLASLTINGNGKTISQASGASYGSRYTKDGGAAFFFGTSLTKDETTRDVTDGAYTLKNIKFSGFTRRLIDATYSTVNLEDCMFQNNHVTVGMGSGSSTDMIETLNAALKIDGCTFTGNTTSGIYALIYTNNQDADSTVTISNNLFKDNGTENSPVCGNALVLLSNVTSNNDAVTDNTFTNNYISSLTNQNAAVLYVSKPVENISGNLFIGNHVTAPYNKKEGVIVLGGSAGGSNITGNAFVNNTLGENVDLFATVYTGADCDLSNNYWGDSRAAAVYGVGKDYVFESGKTPTVTFTSGEYASYYAANSGTNGATVSNEPPVVDYYGKITELGASYSDAMTLKFFVTLTKEVSSPQFTVTRDADSKKLTQVTSENAFLTAKESVYLVTNLGEGSYEIRVKLFAMWLSSPVTLRMFDGDTAGEALKLHGYNYSAAEVTREDGTDMSYSMLDYLKIMKTWQSSDARYSSMYNAIEAYGEAGAQWRS